MQLAFLEIISLYGSLDIHFNKCNSTNGYLYIAVGIYLKLNLHTWNR